MSVCVCGATENVRYFLRGFRCPEHTPAAIAGHPEPPQPDPKRTLVGLMRAANENLTLV